MSYKICISLYRFFVSLKSLTIVSPYRISVSHKSLGVLDPQWLSWTPIHRIRPVFHCIDFLYRSSLWLLYHCIDFLYRTSLWGFWTPNDSVGPPYIVLDLYFTVSIFCITQVFDYCITVSIFCIAQVFGGFGPPMTQLDPPMTQLAPIHHIRAVFHCIDFLYHSSLWLLYHCIDFLYHTSLWGFWTPNVSVGPHWLPWTPNDSIGPPYTVLDLYFTVSIFCIAQVFDYCITVSNFRIA
jgi:hypothetical protein